MLVSGSQQDDNSKDEKIEDLLIYRLVTSLFEIIKIPSVEYSKQNCPEIYPEFCKLTVFLIQLIWCLAVSFVVTFIGLITALLAIVFLKIYLREKIKEINLLQNKSLVQRQI